MTLTRYTVTPFLLALVAGLAAMPTNIYKLCAWNVGTLKVDPWRQRASGAMRATTRTILGWFAGLWNPRLGFLAAGVILALLIAHLSGSHDGLMLAAIPGLAGMSLPDLRQRKGELAQQAIQCLSDAASREWISEDETKFNAIHVDIEDINKHIARREKMEAVTASLADGQGRRTDPTMPSQTPRPDVSAARGLMRAPAVDHAMAMIGWFLAGSNRRTDAHVAAAKRCGIDIDGKSLYLGLAARPPASTRQADLEDWEKRYLGVAIESPDNGGHYLVPDETMRGLEVALLAFGGMRSVATVLRTDTGANLPMPTMNDTGNEGAIIAEQIQETSDVEPTIGQLLFEAFTYSSKKIPVWKSVV